MQKPNVHGHEWEWFWYLTAAVLSLAYKFFKMLYEAQKAGIPRKKAIQEWFFEGSIDNTVSWAATVGIVWLGGVAYIERVDWIYPDYFNAVPAHNAIAFVLGGTMEQVAPNVAKWITQKFLSWTQK